MFCVLQMSSRTSRCCFCNFCKGNTQLTRSKIRQHEKVYGLWDANILSEAKEGPSTSKKTRYERSLFANEDVLLEEEHDDYPTNYDSDGTDHDVAQSSSVCSNSTKLEVMNLL